MNGHLTDPVRPTDPRVRRRLLTVAVAAMLAVGLLAAAPAGANPAFPPAFPPNQNQLPQLPREPDIYRALPITTPDSDPWYNDPPNIAAYRPGQIVRSRVVQTRVLGIPFPVHTKQLLYRSENAHGQPIVTATSVIIPGVPWSGSPRPVVSFQEAIDRLHQFGVQSVVHPADRHLQGGHPRDILARPGFRGQRP